MLPNAGYIGEISKIHSFGMLRRLVPSLRFLTELYFRYFAAFICFVVFAERFVGQSNCKFAAWRI